jgi:hypothetical protein
MIDALIPWVDSDDPAWQEKYIHYKATASDLGYFKDATATTRFRDLGELNRCLRSVAKNAPWFRKIFILTDNQTPYLSDVPDETRYKIRIVSHQDIFGCRPDVLPTFNSIAFDCMVWNIDEMAERFVYLNDDFFIARPVTPNDFFDDERIIVRGNWSPMRRSLMSRIRRRLTGAAERTTGFADGQRKAAEMLGFEGKYFKFNHAPRAILKSRMKAVFDAFREDVERNISYRFRHPDQFLFFALYYHEEMANRALTFADPRSTVNIKGRLPFKGEISRLRTALKEPRVKFLCLQSLDAFSEDQIADVMHVLDSHLNL